MLLAADRQTGKSTQAFAWVSHGERTDGYPGWTRVLVLAHHRAYDLWRRQYWERLEDFDHRVYCLNNWMGARSVRPSTEVCVDDLDWAVLGTAGLSWMPGHLTAATITAAPWDRLEFRERAPPEWRG